jgi:glycerol-3-phosphate dehydrogenase
MGETLGWDEARIELETAIYLQRVEAERASQLEPNDESADRIRLEAPDIVTTSGSTSTGRN